MIILHVQTLVFSIHKLCCVLFFIGALHAKSSNILEYVCHMFYSEMLNTSTHKICHLNSTGRDLGAVSEEPKEDFGVNRYMSGRSPLLKHSDFYFPEKQKSFFNPSKNLSSNNT